MAHHQSPEGGPSHGLMALGSKYRLEEFAQVFDLRDSDGRPFLLIVDKPSITGQSGTVPSNRAWSCSNRKEPRFEDHEVSPQRDQSSPEFKRFPSINDQKAGNQKVQFAPYPQSPASPDRSSWMPWTWQPWISSAEYGCRASAVRLLVVFC